MPIYEYKCRACGSVSELLVGRGDDASGFACTACGKKELDKILSAPNVHTVQPTSAAKSSCGMVETCQGQSPGCASGCCAMK